MEQVKERIMMSADELLQWISENDLTINLNYKEAELITNYLEGHGYGLYVEDGKLLRVDVEDEQSEDEERTIDDIIDTICEWNYELKTIAEEDLANADNILDEGECRERIASLERDEEVLDALYAKTIYGKQTTAFVEKVVSESSGLQQNVVAERGVIR